MNSFVKRIAGLVDVYTDHLRKGGVSNWDEVLSLSLFCFVFFEHFDCSPQATKLLFGFHVVLGMTSEDKSYVDLNEISGLYETLGSGRLGDEKVVKENLRRIVNFYLASTLKPSHALWKISKQRKSRIDSYRIAAWYNLFNVRYQPDTQDIQANLHTTKNLDELLSFVECEKWLFQSRPAAISLQALYQKCLEES